MRLSELILGRSKTKEISVDGWFMTESSYIRRILNDGKNRLFSNQSDKSYYKGRCLSEIPLCHCMVGISFPAGFTYIPTIGFRKNRRHGQVNLNGNNWSHAFAVSPDEHKVLCLTFGQYISPKIRGVNYDRPGAVIKAYKLLAPDLVTVSGSGENMVAMLCGNKQDIGNRLGLWYRVTVN